MGVTTAGLGLMEVKGSRGRRELPGITLWGDHQKSAGKGEGGGNIRVVRAVGWSPGITGKGLSMQTLGPSGSLALRSRCGLEVSRPQCWGKGTPPTPESCTLDKAERGRRGLEPRNSHVWGPACFRPFLDDGEAAWRLRALWRMGELALSLCARVRAADPPFSIPHLQPH